ncbi:MAG TPA: hypothetical protein VMT86_11155 [Bryobacteraceae bacterium]|nr:hypothetical protein [Bryobacteraceae bacterium]
MDDAEKTREAARSIRPYLRQLVPDDAESLDARIADLLNNPPGLDDDLLLLEALCSCDATRTWMADFLQNGIPPSLTRGFVGTVSEPVHVNIDKYACPFGDYNWYAVTVGDDIPVCPNHKTALQSVGPRK